MLRESGAYLFYGFVANGLTIRKMKKDCFGAIFFSGKEAYGKRLSSLSIWLIV
jgi:hypothetical protein